MPTTVEGLFSGIDTGKIIEQLIAIERRPINVLEKRVASTKEEKTKLLEISAKLLALQGRAKTLADPEAFKRVNVTSSNPGALVASGSKEATATGTFSFQVARLSSSARLRSRGFEAKTSTPGAGTVKIALGGGLVAPGARLNSLRGAQGVSPGVIDITDRSGKSGRVDLTAAVTVDDVVAAINNAPGVSVRASTTGDRLLVTDSSGGTGNLKVVDVQGRAAADFGIAQDVSAASITGADVVALARSTPLAQLRDGLGVLDVPGSDIKFTRRDGTTFTVDLNGATTLGGALDAINNAAGNGGKLVAAIAGDGNRLQLVDTSTSASGTLKVEAVGVSSAARDLGIEGQTTGSGASLLSTGQRVLAGLRTVLLSTLKGGAGVGAGTLSIADRAGNARSVVLTGAETLDDVVGMVNGNGVARVRLEVNDAGNGLRLADASGGTGNLVFTDSAGTTAADLGLDTGPAGVAASEKDGGDAVVAFVSLATRLSSLNAGRGVSAGKIKITDSKGASAVVDLTAVVASGTARNVIINVNSAGIGVTASIDSTGTGILLADTAGGGGRLKVEEVAGGRTAADLALKGQAAASGPNLIDGSFVRSVAVAATDTLEGLVKKINDLDAGVSAAILDVGGATPYRLSISSGRAGTAASLLVDDGALDLGMARTQTGSDSVLLMGSFQGGNSPLRVTSATDTVKDVVPGLTLDLLQTTTGPVDVKISRDDEFLASGMESLVGKLNAALENIDEALANDPKSQKKGILYDDTSVGGLRGTIINLLVNPVEGAGSLRTFSQLGVSLDFNGRFTFSKEKFRSVMDTDRAGVEAFLSTKDKGGAARLEKSLDTITKPADGLITRMTETRDDRIEIYEDQIDSISERVLARAERMRRDFLQMEFAFKKAQGILSRLSAQLSGLTPASGGLGFLGVGGRSK